MRLIARATARVDSTDLRGAQCTLLAHATPNGAGGIPEVTQAPSIVDSANSPTLWATVVHGFASTGGIVDLVCVSGSKASPARVHDIRIAAFRISGGS